MYFSHTKHLRPRWHGWLGSSAILNVQLLSLESPSFSHSCMPTNEKGTEEQKEYMPVPFEGTT